ncbi:PREDICTED: protein S100-A11-like, partial [Lipotes vexillifer]|uniref:Protein S100 n=1 Tax=Lipotes vexillifer TaxID=118797 RepID=A0A340XEV4_LIPVE
LFVFYLPVIHSSVKCRSSKLGIRLSNENKQAFSNGKNDLIEEQKLAEKQQVSSPTETEQCIESLIAVFQKHAGRDGNNSKLSKAKFLIFMNTELGAFTKKQKDPGVLDRMMKKLDLDSDGQLDFQEFLNLIGGLAIACHDSFIKSTYSLK